MTKVRDIFSNQNKTQSKKGQKIPPGFIEMLKQSGEIPDHTPETKEKVREEKVKKLQREQEKAQSHFQRVKKLEKEVYSRKKKETEREIEMLRKALAEEVKNLKEQGQRLQSEIQAAVQEPTVNPGQSDVSFFENLIRTVRRLTEKVEDAALWMEAWNQKRSKKGSFWANVGSKKGGAQYLLSSEHSVSRSAG